MNPTDDSDTLPDGRRIPTLFAVSSESGQTLRVWCRFCGRHHTHGRTPASNGHVVAHCAVEDSPYLDTGYMIVELEGPLPDPPYVIKPRYTRDGRYISGYLLRQRRQLEAREKDRTP